MKLLMKKEDTWFIIKCVEAEEAVKTGRMNDVMSVEMLIMGVFGE